MAEQLKVLTYNIMKLGSVAGPEKVISGIAALGADIVLLQEVFNTQFGLGVDFENAKRKLEERLPGFGYRLDWSPSSGPGPLKFLTFGKFQDGLMVGYLEDKWTPMGGEVLTKSLGGLFGRRIVQCRLLGGNLDGHPLTLAVCNTHLSFGNKESKRKRRKKQIQRMQEFMASEVQSHQPSHLILGGDLNSPGPTNGGPTSEEYQLVIGGGASDVAFEDTWVAAHAPGDAGLTFDLGNTNVEGAPWEASVRIDYVLQHRPAIEEAGAGLVPLQSSVELHETIDGSHLSDHFGVLTTFELSGD